MGLRRVRSSRGDIFALPLETHLGEHTVGGRGEYLPGKEELCVLAQFVFGETKDAPLLSSAGWGRTMMCFGTPQRYSDINLESARSLVLSTQPIMEFKVISEAMDRAWWPKIGASEVSKMLPHQSYRFVGQRVMDYHAKVTSIRPDLILRGIGQSVNSSMARALVAHIFGVREAEWPDFNYDEYLVTEERAVWNVFPDRYTMDPIQGLLFDGIPVDSVQHM